MNIRVYYFTGTGNSLKIARDLSGALGVSELFSMTKLAKQEGEIRIDGDVVCFVFPVYFARPPVFIDEFIERSSFTGTQYISAVINGGGLFGRALPLFDAMLHKKGQKLDSGFIIPMPGNHPKFARLIRRAHEEYYKGEEEKIRFISDIIGQQQPHNVETNWGLMGRILSSYGFRKAYSLSLAKKLDSSFWVNDSCTKCGTCVRICPTGNISLEYENPRWHGDCINCAACYHHCPENAICLGKEDPDFRYTHPGVSAQNIIDGNG